jgi:hypothetical protein
MAKASIQSIPQRLLGMAFGEVGLDIVRRLMATAEGANRAQIARKVCSELGWVSALGKPRLLSARVALLGLDRRGLIKLPAPTGTNGNKSLRARNGARQNLELPKAEALQTPVDRLEELCLWRVEARHQSALYYALLERHHYLGGHYAGGPHLVRYFFGLKQQRILGVIGFGPAAFKVGVRDTFLGWQSIPQQQRQLHLIVNNCRFLILPWVRCRNLASKVLSLCARRLPGDFATLYGYEPVLLETFVQRDLFRGTCYQAANWLYVGQSAGRGKRDRFHRGGLPRKDVWLYPLRRDFRRHLSAGFAVP